MMAKATKFSQRQMDDEFEQFLKESFSDDSVDSDRLNKYFAKTKQEEQRKKKESQPWWMQDNEADEDEDASKREKAKGKPAAENKWLKPKKQLTPLKDNDEKTEKAQKASAQKVQGIHSSMNKKKVDMSKDSLEDLTMSGRPDHSMPIDRSGVMPTQASFEETLSYTETGTSDGLTPASTGPGMDTLEEQADKERFFKDLEAKRGGKVDYRKLMKEADMSNTMGSMRSGNLSMTMGSMPSAYMGTADEHSSPLPYKPSPVEEDDYEDDNDQDQTPPTASETSPSQPSLQPSKQMKSPKKGMLAKVALLDTGESMFDTSGLQGEATIKKKDRDYLAAGDTKMGATNNLTLGSTGLLTGGTATEFEALQAALREAANTPTMDFSSTGMGLDATQDGTQSRTVDDIIREVNNEKRKILENADDIMSRLRRDDEGEGGRSEQTNDLQPANESRGFNLQPSNERRGFDMQTANESRGFDLPPSNESRGFDLQPANESRGVDLQPSNESRGFDLQPANESRGFDLQPSNESRGFDLQPANESRGFDLQPANGSRGFDLQPANESRGFDLQPSNESRGFDLQLANGSRGFDLQPANESRGFDLQPANDVHPISADDENSQRRSSQMKPKRARQTRAAGSKATVPRYSHVKGSGYGKPKSAAVWSPVDAAKQRVKGSEVPRLQDRPPVGVGKNIMASVESFAHYIQDHFVDSGKQEPPKSPPIRPQRSTEDPLLSASMRESRLQLVSRERALVNEVSEWQAQWKEEHKLTAKLKAEMAALQREAARKEEELALNHQRELFKLKQDNFVLQAKLNTVDDQQKARKQTVSGRSLEGATEEEVKLMQKEIIEQETLLHGYQQENERLYSEVRKLQKSNSEVEEKVFRENQKLQTELATVKELLEQRDVALRHKGLITGLKMQQEIAAGNNTAILGAGRIAELQVELREAEMQDASHKQRIRQADEASQELKQHIETLVREKNHAQEKLQNVRDVKQREFQDMQQQYQREIETLQKKVRWYAENQELLDKDTNALREKEEEVKRLKDTLEKVNKQTSQKTTEAQRRARERGADAKRIQDLERQVKEMNDIIRKRHPNSLPALIYAAASASNPDPAQDGHHASAPAKSHTVAFLEGKVKKMESELDEKESDAKIYARVLEQKYNTMKFQYEDRLQALEKQLKASRQQHQEAVSKVHPHPNMASLERELENTKELHQKKMLELKAENDELRRKLVRSLKVAWMDQSKEEGGGGEVQGDSLQMKLMSLAKELSNKDHEIEMLKSTCERLMEDKFQAFSAGESSRVKEKPSGTKKSKRSKSVAGHLSGGKHYQPENFTGTHVSDVLSENAQLKQQMEQIALEMEQQRVGLQASLAQSEGAVRRAQEEASEDIASLRAIHAAEMESLVAKRALQHSDSKHAKLISQLDSQQVMIRHLQEQLLDARVDQDSLSAARVREQLLKTQLEQLTEDLNEAKKSHSPEMRHFEALQAKIATMEARHVRREQELQQLITRARHSASYEKDQEISGYQQILAAKNKELQQFRTELDAILEVLRELQRQGVVLPLQSHIVQSLLR